MRAGGDVLADLGQVLVRRPQAYAWQHEGCTDAALGADGAEQIGGAEPQIAAAHGALAAQAPDPGQRALLADTHFILEPQLDAYGLGVRGGDRGECCRTFLF